MLCRLLMLASYVTLFYLNFAQIVGVLWVEIVKLVPTSLPVLSPHISTLYEVSIVVGCLTFLLCEVVMLLHRPFKLCPLLYLTSAGVIGGTFFILYAVYNCLLCIIFGAWSVQVKALLCCVCMIADWSLSCVCVCVLAPSREYGTMAQTLLWAFSYCILWTPESKPLLLSLNHQLLTQ